MLTEEGVNGSEEWTERVEIGMCAAGHDDKLASGMTASASPCMSKTGAVISAIRLLGAMSS